VRVGSTEGVVAFGRVDDTELRDLYAHAEALVLPSLWEGFGLPVAEALATGCRVACSDIPALRELAGEDATYFDPASPEAISEGILRALTEPRPHPRRGTSWDDAAASVVALWRELVP
jgi:glycosyltransferase involved in cell wall biosynthesis